MQSTYLISSAWVGGGGTGVAARNRRWAAAKYWLHTPVAVSGPPTMRGTPGPASGPMMLITPWASIVGSAWLGSPWWRMHVAHWSTSSVGPPEGAGVADAPLP